MKLGLTRVEAPTMREALEKVRAKLGTDALIVKTRTFRRGGVLGVGRHEVVEVYATGTRSRIENVERARSRRSQGAGPAAAADLEKDPAPSRPRRAAAASAADTPSASTDPSPLERYEEISSALEKVRSEIRNIKERAGGPSFDHPFLSDCYELLVAREVDPRLAERIVRQISFGSVPDGLPDPARVRAVLRAQLTNLFVPCPPLKERRGPRLIVLVGPTGVGKTTTIAKLAARAKLNEEQNVGLITLDTFRIAAVDQLEKYAQIIGLPLKVAKNPRHLEEAVAEFEAQGADLVFIDSAGRSPRDELKMAELREFLSVLPGAEIHLVVSTTTHGKTIESIASRFSNLGFHMLILTKLDETVSFGSLVNALIAIGRPISFITDGQNVPDDIMLGDPDRLADLMLKTNAL
jgi:flagellar biosynthesis protein FlhF